MRVDDSRPVTRAERQARTRERLIEKAAQMFLTDGYAATSLDHVALEAGFSKGAVYSNFAGKEELCLAVLDVIHAEQVEAVVAAFSKETDLGGRIEAFTEWARKGLGQPRWTALEVEFASAARQSPYVAAELAKRHRAIREAIAALLKSVLDEAGVEMAMSPDQAATALLSLGIGLGAMRSLDSTVDVEAFGATMRAMFGTGQHIS